MSFFLYNASSRSHFVACTLCLILKSNSRLNILETSCEQDLALTYTGKVEESMYQRYLQLAMKYFGMSGFSKKKVEMERLLAQRKVPRRDKTS